MYYVVSVFTTPPSPPQTHTRVVQYPLVEGSDAELRMLSDFKDSTGQVQMLEQFRMYAQDKLRRLAKRTRVSPAILLQIARRPTKSDKYHASILRACGWTGEERRKRWGKFRQMVEWLGHHQAAGGPSPVASSSHASAVADASTTAPSTTAPSTTAPATTYTFQHRAPDVDEAFDASVNAFTLKPVPHHCATFLRSRNVNHMQQAHYVLIEHRTNNVPEGTLL